MATIENGIITAPVDDSPINKKGLGWDLFESMRQHKDKIAQICATTGARETFGELLKRVIRTALEIKKRGIACSDVIATCTYNHLNSLVPMFASIFLNCKTSPLHPSFILKDTIHLINIIRPKYIFIDEDSEEIYSKLKESINEFEFTIISFSLTSKFEWFGNFLKPHENENEFEPTAVRNLKETIVIYFSSGTTGLPKGVCLHHYGLMKQTSEVKLQETDSVMFYTPNLWISSFASVCVCTRSGLARVICKQFNQNTIWKVIDVFQPTAMTTAPYQLLTMLSHKGVPKNVRNSLRAIYLIGDRMPPELLEGAQESMHPTLILNSYGLTETAGLLTVFNLPKDMKDFLGKPTSCGKLRPGFTCKLVNLENNKICGPYEEGEMYVKSDILTNGYFNKSTESPFDPDGWLKTGDVVYYDDDLCFYFYERSKEILKYQMYQIPPVKIEQILCSHPEVEKAVVFGIPDIFDGEHPCGIVQVKSNSSLTSETLKEFADTQLDETHKLRGGLHIIDEFPMTPTGKINRRLTKELFMPAASQRGE